MKISVDVDCTPEEARRFMGLPDLEPVHAIYVDRLKKTFEEGVSPETIDAMMRTWSPMGDASMAMWRGLMGQMQDAMKK